MQKLNYISVHFKASEEQAQIISALLLNLGFEGIDESEEEVIAFVSESSFNGPAVEQIFKTQDVAYYTNLIAQQNWNSAWEKSFEPVRIDRFVTIRADFHPPDQEAEYEIIITPKMSFGTGHHATTYLMIAEMQQLNFSGKNIIDFGTGTAVLAILSEKLGAKHILAIDNDIWSITNAEENIKANNCTEIKLFQCDYLSFTEQADIILANINLNIILTSLESCVQALAPGGYILFSGLLASDEDYFKKMLHQQGFIINKILHKDNWMLINASL